MSKFTFLLFSALAFVATAATAQEIDCADPANVGNAACVNLPGIDDVQNFVLGIVPIIGGGGILAAGLISGGDNTTSTTSTTN